jgi:hypothetical protein
VAYDPEGRFHYLFQCMARDGTWNGCHVEHEGDDPVGVWRGDGGVAIRGGSLWSLICGPGSRCASGAPVVDEGTFNIFGREDGDYLVSFHGYDGTNAYRGIARTPDFVHWSAGASAAGMPGDAVFAPQDAASWREAWQGPPVGGGGGGILRESDNVFYMVVEAADRTLGCDPGQDWDVGFLRTRDLGSVPWESLPRGNPVAYSGKEAGSACNPSYNRLFQDGGVRYWTHHRMGEGDDALYLYALVPSSNRLENADLWRCDARGWRAEGVSMRVPRMPSLSSHGGCFLDLQCTTSSCPGEVSQEVPAADLAGRSVAFGGRFATSGTVEVRVGLEERDAGGGLLGVRSQSVPRGERYAGVSETMTLSPRAALVRLVLRVQGDGGVRADELFLTGCGEGPRK